MSGTTPKRTARLAAGALLAIATLGTACDTEPSPPPAQLIVNSTANLADANPGDGTCEATPGAGDCTVRAAIDEGNALGRADITLATPGEHLARALISVTGNLTISGPSGAIITSVADDSPLDPALVGDVTLEVSGGGSLLISDISISGYQIEVASGGAFAAFHARVSALGGLIAYTPIGPTLSIDEGGTALIQSSIVGNYGSTSIVNRGRLGIDQSTVGNSSFGAGVIVKALQTTGAGTTHLRGSWIAGTGCNGTLPTSMGYNAAVGTTCGLTGPTDLQNAPTNLSGAGSSSAPSGPLVDAIPQGEALCGTVLVDVNGNPRPTDGDGDGTAACDIGALEG